MHRRALLLSAAAAVALTGCAGTAAGPTSALTDPAEEGVPGDGEPIPVEGDGGIGGPGDPIVRSNLFLAGERVEVAATCLVTEAPPTYRLDAAGGTTVTVTVGDEGGAVEVRTADGTVLRPPEAEPPTPTTSAGAVVAQGRVVGADGEERLVDATVGTSELPDC